MSERKIRFDLVATIELDADRVETSMKLYGTAMQAIPQEFLEILDDPELTEIDE